MESDVIQNQVRNAYNDFRQQTNSYQEHSSSVNMSSTPKVQYSYADGTFNTIRMLSMTYPSGRTLSNNYGTSGEIDDSLGRIQSMSDSGGTLVEYQYLGTSSFVNAASA